MRRAINAFVAIAAALMSAPASASVTYSFEGTESFYNFIGLFSYTSPTSISSNLSVASSDLNSCGVLPDTWSCASVEFMPTSGDDLIVFSSTQGDGTLLSFIFEFAPGTFGGPNGGYFAIPRGDYYGTLSITRTADAVPEPATWAMMLMGFGIIGCAMRKLRKPALAELA